MAGEADVKEAAAVHLSASVQTFLRCAMNCFDPVAQATTFPTRFSALADLRGR